MAIIRVTCQQADKKTTMASAPKGDHWFVNKVLVEIERLECELTAVVHIVIADLAKQGLKLFLSKTNRTSVVYYQKAVSERQQVVLKRNEVREMEAWKGPPMNHHY